MPNNLGNKYKYKPPWYIGNNIKLFTTESSSKYITPEKQIHQKQKQKMKYTY